jgi:hypothetical protein
MNKYRVSQKWHTNGALRCRTDYRKRQTNVKKLLLNFFGDLAVFESGTLQVNYFEICICIVYFLIKEPRPVDLLNLGNLMISIGYTSQRLSFLMSFKLRKLSAKI